MIQPDVTELPPNPTLANESALLEGMDVLISQALFTLTPFFMDGAKGDEAKACAAAKEILISYKIVSAVEIQLAVECILFAYTAMESLRQAKAEPDMPEPKRLRQRNSAVSLNRAGHRTRQALNALQKVRPPAAQPAAEAPQPDPGFDPSAKMRDFVDKLTGGGEFMLPGFPVSSEPAVPPPFMNREQRRAAELMARREARRARG